jgi:hypothetical protein
MFIRQTQRGRWTKKDETRSAYFTCAGEARQSVIQGKKSTQYCVPSAEFGYQPSAVSDQQAKRLKAVR